MRVGDVANFVALVNALVFCVLAFAHGHGFLNFFSAGFQRDGFCVSFKETAFQSHVLSFYGDAVFAGIFWLLARYKSGSPGFSYIEKSITGILGHGCGHLYVYFKSESFADKPAFFRKPEPAFRAFVVVFFFIFWYKLLQGALIESTPRWQIALHALFHSLFHVMCVPGKFAFIYVQTVTLVMASLAELARSKKDRFYDLYALLVVMPIGLVGWLEAGACDTMLVHIGGHAWYDWTIPISMVVYYLACQRVQRSESIKAE